jgi:hypothetical protein
MFAAIAVRQQCLLRNFCESNYRSLDGFSVTIWPLLRCFTQLNSPFPTRRNKWVLLKTDIPVFFLFVQLSIAVVLLAITKWVGMFQISFELNKDTCKALFPMVAINVLGLK